MSSIVEIVGSADAELEGAAPTPVRSGAEQPLTVIEAHDGWRLVDLRELWRYRELLFFLAWRDVKVRYKQTVLGAAWAVLQPFATMVVFTFVLSRVAGVIPGDVPYPLFAFCGLVAWYFFANAILASSQSVVGNQNLVTKIYFPRLFIPLGSIGAGLIDFLVACLMVLAMLAYYGIAPSPSLLLVPVLAAGLLVAATGVGTLLAALTVSYRDFRHVVPFLVQLWMFATPCIYLDVATAVGPRGQAIFPFNPAYGLTLNFRAAILGTPLDYYSLTVSSLVSLAILVIGLAYFRRVERGFADVI